MTPFADYVGHGWKITPIEPGQKSPTHMGWNLRENAVTHPLAAERLSAAGLCHAYSGTCAIDIDDFEAARTWLMLHDIDLDALFHASDAVRIQSPKDNRGKLLYALPEPMPSKKVLDGKRTILEFRCATAAGATVQDVLPPSPYPGGGLYQWVGNWRSLPPLPTELHSAWAALAGSQEPSRLNAEPTISRDELAALLEDLDPDLGYDDWLRVGMAIHHEYGGSDEGFATWLTWSAGGSKFKGEQDLVSHWRSFSSGGGITGLSLRQMQGAMADDFPIVPPDPERSPDYLRPKDLLAPRDLPPYLIDGILEQDAECSIVGPTGSYKSLFAFTMAASVSTGAEFFGRPAERGLVLMLVGEGRGGIRKRFQGLELGAGYDIGGATLAVYEKPLTLPTAENVNFIRAMIAKAEQEFQCKLKTLIIDTYSRYAAGDEDKTGDIYTFFRAARACRGSASLIICHHTGHGDKSRARGSSAWGQLVDTEFVASIDEDSGIRIFTNTKQKDGELCAPMFFTLAAAPTRLTRAGVPITTVVLEPTVLEVPTAGLTDNEQIVFDVVKANQGATEEQIIAIAVEQVVKPKGRDTRPKAMRRALQVLVQENRVSIENGHVRIVDNLTNFTDLIGAERNE